MSEIREIATPFYARWSEDRTMPQLLVDHLRGVSQRGELFAKRAMPTETTFERSAALAGVLHDLGKYRSEFQEYLNAGDRSRRTTETDHAVYGAAAAGCHWDSLAVAFAIAAHHAGLHNLAQLMKLIDGDRYRSIDRYPALLGFGECRELVSKVEAPPSCETSGVAAVSASLRFLEGDLADQRRFEVVVRMLFSILVDADRLDSEKFEQEYRRQRPWERITATLNAAALLVKLELARVAKGNEKKESRPELNELRNSIFEVCRRNGRAFPRGFFSLTVPTGGGKTMSSMAFALEHALANDQRRVIVVIPYLSIIEQNAKDYRKIFGADQILEHHSGVDVTSPAKEADGGEPAQVLDIERAAENWDVPIVVTTAVQFIESLFASSPARARKLHNIAQSVVIFDEVQTMPTHLLEPTLDVLRTLQQHFGVTVVFCSATQPGFLRSGNLRHGFDAGEVREIAPSPEQLFQKLRRVRYKIQPPQSCWSWDHLANQMLTVPKLQSLVILNLRQHAFEAFLSLKRRLSEADSSIAGSPELREKAVFHLSSSMCAAHRLDVLGLSNSPPPNNIKQRLLDNLPCWVISTQLIEAGVDVDFPTVFRAMGPLDSIVQAAGRCNREGQLQNENGEFVPGEVVIFHPELPAGKSGIPPGNYAKATALAPNYLGDPEDLAINPQLFARYFHELFQITATDHVRPGEDTIQESREKFNFRTVAERAKVIKEDTIAVIVPYRAARKLIRGIQRSKRLSYGVLRRLQRFMVSLRRGPNSDYQKLKDAGRLQPLLPGILEIPVIDAECYDAERGIVFKEQSLDDFIQ